jgi:signal transduction histidine kinase
VDVMTVAGTGTTGVPAVAPQADIAAILIRTRLAGNHVSITIQDRGVGISPEDMAHIFDPYFTTRRAGTGLGLPIAKNIVEGLGGTLVVSSQRGEGTQIRIDLQLSPPEPRA